MTSVTGTPSRPFHHKAEPPAHPDVMKPSLVTNEKTEGQLIAGSGELPPVEQPPQSNGLPVKLIPSSAPPQQPVSKSPSQESLPMPEPQQTPPVGDPQVTVRLVKPEEADVVAKQVCCSHQYLKQFPLFAMAP